MEKSKLILYLSIIIVFFLCSKKNYGKANLTDSLALVALYDSTDGPNWKNNINWLLDPFDNWYGVTLTDNRVSELVLSSNNLNGTLPPEIENLTNLVAVSFSNNLMNGKVPVEFTTLTNLQKVLINGNSFTDLPDFSVLPLIEYLYVQSNNFTFGDLEPNIGISNFLYTPQGNIGELIDTTIEEGRSATFRISVDGTANQYKWFKDGIAIPGAITDSLKISNFDVADTGVYHLEVTNTIVTGLTLISHPITLSYDPPVYNRETDSLALVALYNSTDGPNWKNNINWLTGPIEGWDGVFLAYNRVSRLILSSNNLNGTLPPEIGNLTELVYLSLSFNQLTGNVPIEIGNLINLTTLNLSSNQLSGAVPLEIGNLTKLTDLDLNNNQFTGTIPPEIGNLINLVTLSLSNNQFTEPIPEELWSLENLYSLSLSRNKIVDTIPTAIGNLTNLNSCVLSYNSMYGKIPVEFTTLTKLQLISLQDNSFTDFPDFSVLPSLVYLLTWNNNFTFGDLEPNIGISKFYYSPQANIGEVIDTSIEEGNSLTFRILVDGTANQYQWFKDGIAIPGETADSIKFSSIVMADAGVYHLEVTNSIVTGLTLISNPITIGVDAAPLSITLQPVDETVCENSVASFIIGNTGTLTYQWQVSTDGGTSFTDLIDGGEYNGVSDSILNIDPVSYSQNGYVYRCIINGSLISNNAVLTVEPGNYIISSMSLICSSSSIYIPVETVNNITGDVIGLDFSLEYDATMLTPTGDAIVGDVVHGGNNSYSDYFLNTNTAGVVNGIVYFTGYAPYPSFFSGNGMVIEVEFTLNSSASPGDISDILLSRALESTLSSGNIDHCSFGPVQVEVTNDPIFAGSIHFWNRNSRPLRYDSLNPSDYLPTIISGRDGLCNVTGSTTYLPDYEGDFEYPVIEGDYIKIERDIPGDYFDTTNCTNVMSWINGSDQNRVMRIATLDSTLTPSNYQIIAADVNRDGIINAADVTLISARTVMTICGFPNNGPDPSIDWVFIDETTLDNDPAYAISATYPNDDGIGYSKNRVPAIPDCLSVPFDSNGSCVSTLTEDYAAILLGDVSGNWRSDDGGILKSDASGKVIIDIENAVDNSVNWLIPIKFLNTEQMESFDFDIKYKTNTIDIVDISVSDNYSGKINHNWNTLNDNEVLMSSYSMERLSTSGNPFYLEVYSANQDITEDMFSSAIAYINGEPVDVEFSKSQEIRGQWIAYPNPCNDILHVQFKDGLNDQAIRLEIVNSMGKVVYIYESSSEHESWIELDVSHLEQGMYYMKILATDYFESIKILK